MSPNLSARKAGRRAVLGRYALGQPGDCDRARRRQSDGGAGRKSIASEALTVATNRVLALCPYGTQVAGKGANAMEFTRRHALGVAGASAALTVAQTALAAWQPNERYPDPAITSLDPSFNKYRVAQASVERIA